MMEIEGPVCVEYGAFNSFTKPSCMIFFFFLFFFLMLSVPKSEGRPPRDSHSFRAFVDKWV